MTDLSLLALGWALYGVLHSMLADARVKALVERWLPGLGARYRLTYNLIASLTLIPLVYGAYALEGPLLIQWRGAWAWLADGLGLAALIGLYLTTRAYDMGAFLGLRPEGHMGFQIGAAHRFVRHPWYSLSLVLIWTQDMTPALLVSALPITVYLFVGSWLEERRLIADLGEAYLRYRARVPGIIPWRGRALSAEEAARLAASPLSCA